MGDVKGMTISDAVEVEFPKAKVVHIGTSASGEIKPWISGDRLIWHACVRPSRGRQGIGLFLLQGFGPTPRAAVADAILSYRREQQANTLLFAEIQKDLDVAGQSDEQLAAIARSLNS